MSVVLPSATVGDPILLLNRRWFDLMLQGVKTLEIWHHRLSPGKRLVGEKGVIWGCVVLGKDPFQVMSDSQWNDLRPRHRWDSTQTTLPFKKTLAMEVTDLQEFTSTLRYLRIQGSQGTAIYREVPDGWDLDKVHTKAEHEEYMREKGHLADSGAAGRGPRKRPAAAQPAGEVLAGSCIVVGLPKEDAVRLLPAAFRCVVSQASVVEVGTALHNFDGLKDRVCFPLAADVCFLTVFYWDRDDVVERSAWQGVVWNRPTWNRPTAPSTQHPYVMMWSPGAVRGVDAPGLRGSAVKKDADAGTRTSGLQTCLASL